MGSTTVLNEENFDAEVLQSSDPVLVDFWAPWCGPCRGIAPLIDELAEENNGAAKIGKVDVDNNQAIAMKYGVQSLPTLMVFKDGKVLDTMIGAQSKARLQQAIDDAK